ncbi:MAG: O-antigen ligase family protein [Betaproteobacteria bacterium]
MTQTKPRSVSLTFTLPLFCVCLYLMMASVWMPGIAARLYDEARYVELGMLALLLVQLLRPAISETLAGSWLRLSALHRYLILILVAGGAVSAFVSPFIKLGLLEIGLVTQLIFLFGFVACAVREGRARAEAVLAISICAGVALCGLKFWVVYTLYAFEGKTFSWVAPFLEFANVRFFSQFQAYTLFPAVIPLLLSSTRRVWRPFLFLVAANAWALQWMVGTRAVWIGLLVVLVLVPLMLRRDRLSWLRWHAAALLAGLAIYVGFTYVISAHPDVTAPSPTVNSIVRQDQNSIEERTALAQAALKSIREHPALGVGPGQFGLQPYWPFAAHPHNTPLQLLSEYGVIAGSAGIGSGLLLVVFALRTLRSRFPGATDPIGATLVAALLMGTTDAMFSGNLIMPQSQVLFFVVAGWIVGRTPASESITPPETASYRTPRFALVSVGLLAVGVTTILALEYLPLARDIPAWLTPWNPHFWQYGRFNTW